MDRARAPPAAIYLAEEDLTGPTPDAAAFAAVHAWARSVDAGDGRSHRERPPNVKLLPTSDPSMRLRRNDDTSLAAELER